MSDLASLNVKIDRTVKKEADIIANAMGMTLSTAINIFVRQMVNERAIPFKVKLMDYGINRSELLLPPTAITKGWKFNREEANAR